MDWFDDLGNMSSLFPDTPGLAYDFALNGSNPEVMGYGLAYGLQSTPTPIDVYPPYEPAFPDPTAGA